jgi:hypothetical protein
MMPGLWRRNRRRWRRRRRRRRRFRERHGDQALNDVGRVRDVHVQAAEQNHPEARLNGSDRGERNQALPRPYHLSSLGVGGHRPL